MPPLPDHPLDAARQRRRFVIRVVRMAFFVLITTVALVTFIQRATDQGSDQPALSGPAVSRTPAGEPVARPPTTPTRFPAPAEPPEVEVPWWFGVAIALALFAIVLLIDVLTPNKKISSISAVMFGLLAGILATVAISAIIELALRVWLPDKAIVAIQPIINIVKPLLGVALCYLGITTILQTQDDFRLVIPYVEFAKQIRGTKPLLLDSSALIDARIADIAVTGLLQAPLIVPRFVVAELQTLADSTDRLKRARGRRGLEVVSRLQRSGTLDVSIDETPVAAVAVDQALVELAQRLTARIVTTDHGLSRVARIHGVVVLNVHEIAAAFKSSLLPGEAISVRILKSGEHPGQGVGYLEDGTMIVVEHAAAMVGQDVAAQVTGTIQTAAGRMVFARLAETGPDSGAESAVSDGPSRSAEADAPEPVAAAHGPVQVAAPAMPDESPSGSDLEEPVPSELPPPAPAQAAAAMRPAGGPFPPKPPARRPPSPRNPRR
jgi:uncharacterized protein YacL